MTSSGASSATSHATVQNRYDLSERSAEAVLEYCQREDIGFILLLVR